tara:strand:+ start:42 stop:401 length:360 start_codon:yes stop_codon:yes gene_type:complete
MKLTKQKLQQIIKEELENLMGDEPSSDLSKARDFIEKSYNMVKNDENQIELKINQQIITHLRDGGESSIGPIDAEEILALSHQVQKDMGIEMIGPVGFSGFADPDRKEADPRPYGNLGS